MKNFVECYFYVSACWQTILRKACDFSTPSLNCSKRKSERKKVQWKHEQLLKGLLFRASEDVNYISKKTIFDYLLISLGFYINKGFYKERYLSPGDSGLSILDST